MRTAAAVSLTRSRAMDAFVQRCEHCKEPVPETKRGRPQRIPFGQMPTSAPENQCHCRTWPQIPDRATEAKSGYTKLPEVSREFEPENLSQKTNLRFERVNEVTFKLTDGEGTNVPASHGQWGGYRTTKAVAWVINIAPGQWLARCRNEASGPSSFNEAKANALAMARGACADYFVANRIRPPQRTASSPARP